MVNVVVEKWHGKINGYKYHGCRCDGCVKAWQAYGKGWRARNDFLQYHREKSMLAAYGMRLVDWEALYLWQGGRCALCWRDAKATWANQGGKLQIDHDHTTGRIRGLLCTRCNVNLGGYEAIAPYLKDYLQ